MPAPTAYFQTVSLILHRFCSNLEARGSIVTGETSTTIADPSEAFETANAVVILQEESTLEKIDQDYSAPANSTLGQCRFSISSTKLHRQQLS